MLRRSNFRGGHNNNASGWKKSNAARTVILANNPMVTDVRSKSTVKRARLSTRESMNEAKTGSYPAQRKTWHSSTNPGESAAFWAELYQGEKGANNAQRIRSRTEGTFVPLASDWGFVTNEEIMQGARNSRKTTGPSVEALKEKRASATRQSLARISERASVVGGHDVSDGFDFGAAGRTSEYKELNHGFWEDMYGC